MCEWRQQHPDGRKADCHRDTGLDPKTIRNGGIVKHYDEVLGDIQHLGNDIGNDIDNNYNISII